MIRRYLEACGAFGYMLQEVAVDFCTKGVSNRELARQIVKIGRDSLFIVLLTGVFTGAVLALQTAYGLYRFGARNYVGNVVSLGMVRELGPVLTAIMLCGRVSAGIAAEIASMVVTEQVDAIRVLGANPIRKLVTPKVLAGLIAVPALTVFADVIGILGGKLVAVWELGLTPYQYDRSVYYTILIRDVIDGLIKSSVFGVLLTSIACFVGLRCSGGTEGVGKSTTQAVVLSCIAVFVSNFFITKLLISIQF